MGERRIKEIWKEQKEEGFRKVTRITEICD
jgi:hypothetical protein